MIVELKTIRETLATRLGYYCIGRIGAHVWNIGRTFWAECEEKRGHAAVLLCTECMGQISVIDDVAEGPMQGRGSNNPDPVIDRLVNETLKIQDLKMANLKVTDQNVHVDTRIGLQKNGYQSSNQRKMNIGT